MKVAVEVEIHPHRTDMDERDVVRHLSDLPYVKSVVVIRERSNGVSVPWYEKDEETRRGDPDPKVCEYSSGMPCTRAATAFTGGFSDMWVCEGHNIVLAAKSAYGGEGGISQEQFQEQIERAREWFRTHPRPGGSNGGDDAAT